MGICHQFPSSTHLSSLRCVYGKFLFSFKCVFLHLICRAVLTSIPSVLLYYSGTSQLPTSRTKAKVQCHLWITQCLSVFIIIFFYLWVTHCHLSLILFKKELQMKIPTRYYEENIPTSQCALVSFCKQFWLLLKNNPFTLWPLPTCTNVMYYEPFQTVNR